MQVPTSNVQLWFDKSSDQAADTGYYGLSQYVKTIEKNLFEPGNIVCDDSLHKVKAPNLEVSKALQDQWKGQKRKIKDGDEIEDGDCALKLVLAMEMEYSAALLQAMDCEDARAKIKVEGNKTMSPYFGLKVMSRN
jgi:hypothetical protein